MKLGGMKDRIMREYATGFVNMALKFLDVREIGEDLRKINDPMLNIIIDSLKNTIAGYDYQRYREIVWRLGLYALWIIWKDHAYADAGKDVIRQIVLKMKDEPEMLERKPSNKWYINEWWSRQL